ncbi:MAG: hypothetical protein HUJ68_01105 [Clostridia bacterium]|nr:hypothetical protein [Clostridia bacterium]
MFEDDICMCKAETCPLKEKCRRYTAEELKLLQICFTEMQYKEGMCEYFINKLKCI